MEMGGVDSTKHVKANVEQVKKSIEVARKKPIDKSTVVASPEWSAAAKARNKAKQNPKYY